MPDQRLQRPLDTLHRRLWCARTRRRLSRAAAAPALGISAKHLQRIENAQREPTLAQVSAAAALYRVDARWLAFGDPAPEPGEALGEAPRSAPEGPAPASDPEVALLARGFASLARALLARRDGRAAARPRAAAAPLASPYRLEPRPVASLEARHPAFREAVAWFERTGGAVAADEAGFERLLPRLQVLVPRDDDAPYLWCGQQTPPALLLGEAFALSLIGQRALPDDAFDRAFSAAYPGVLRSGRPLTQAAGGPFVVDGRSLPLSWHRWLAPIDFRGYRAVASLAVFDDEVRQPAG